MLPHKGQKGTWEEAGPRGGTGWWDWATVLSPQGHEAAFATEAKQDPGQVCRGLGPVVGRGGRTPLPVASPDLRRKETRVKLWGSRPPVQVTGPGGGEKWLGWLREAGHPKGLSPH